jgi:hypothetical protein
MVIRTGGLSLTGDQGDDRGKRFRERLFTGLNLAVFMTLFACVIVAAVLWERWH